MTDLTLLQQYYICAVNEKGKISGFSTEKQVGLVAAGLLELQLAGCITVDKKVVTVTASLPAGHAHVKPLYDFLNQPKPVRLDTLLEAYGYSITDKRLNELMDCVGASLESMGMAQAAADGVFGGRKAYIPTKQAIGYVVDMVKSELLEDGTVTDEIAALTILLEKSKAMKLYFSDYERKEIQAKLRALAGSQAGKIVQNMIDYVECMIATMSALVTVFS